MKGSFPARAWAFFLTPQGRTEPGGNPRQPTVHQLVDRVGFLWRERNGQSGILVFYVFLVA